MPVRVGSSEGLGLIRPRGKPMAPSQTEQDQSDRGPAGCKWLVAGSSQPRQRPANRICSLRTERFGMADPSEKQVRQRWSKKESQACPNCPQRRE